MSDELHNQDIPEDLPFISDEEREAMIDRAGASFLELEAGRKREGSFLSDRARELQQEARKAREQPVPKPEDATPPPKPEAVTDDSTASKDMPDQDDLVREIREQAALIKTMTESIVKIEISLNDIVANGIQLRG